MKVIAPQGIKCPMEGQPRNYITDKSAVDVPESVYYLRRIKEGSLLRADGNEQGSSQKE
jgi:hypothetical protein